MRRVVLQLSVLGSFGLCALGAMILNAAPGQTAPLHDAYNRSEYAIAPIHSLSPNVLPIVQSDSQDIAQVIAQNEGDIIDVATAAGSFQTFVGLLEELGMAEDLRGYGRFTVFAPTDAAFQSVPPSILEALYADRELMANVLAYHVVASGTPFSAQDLRSQDSLTTLERSTIELERRRGTQYVNDARVVEADIEASNGIIHAIDQVLIPPDVMAELSAR